MFFQAFTNKFLCRFAISQSVKQYSCKSEFARVKPASKVEVFALNVAFNNDKFEKKVNLSMGAYRTDDGKPFVLPIVKKCEREVVCDKKLNHEYLPILGNPNFTKLASELALGKDSPAIKEKRTVPVQTLSGTGGCRIAAEFLAHHLGCKIAYVSNPTWDNHARIFKTSGFKEIKEYTYWDAANQDICFEGVLADLSEAPEGSVIILHACAHNPTGVDPTKEQWKQLAELFKEKKLFPFFDFAYQGFGSGDMDKDAWALRYFIKKGFELMVTQSFAKNMGLYSERIGCLTAVLKDNKNLAAIASQLLILARINYSNPPAHGSRIAERILGDEDYRQEWYETVNEMTCRIKSMREALSDKLKELGTPGKWDHIKKQIGMFSYTGLTKEQCDKLLTEKHIYLLSSGRINVCGLTPKNLDYVAEGISDVVKKTVHS